ncbi:MAG: hypothetical protein IJ733_11390 [Lachnospiraceae bacterium]|nr:hypothetical protein [Lachnospiraceae bacterium]
MWTDLKGWDRPGEENADRVNRFQRDEYGKGRICIPYRLYQSEGEGSLPLVVFLHGADAVGEDNESQLSLHDVGTVFAAPSWQEKHPCHIIAPQYMRGMHWANPVMINALQSLVEYAAEALRADKSRIYIYGYSAGAIGIFSLLKEYSSYYAAAIPICGSTSTENIERLAETPMWLFHAADDPIVSSGRLKMNFGRNEHLGSHVIAEQLQKVDGADVHYTEYPEGVMMDKYGLHPHCSWVLMGQDERAKEWLFSKSR